MDTFAHKLDIGLAGEFLAAHYLQNVLKYTVVSTPGFNRESDILVNGKPVEIKTDVKAAQTGNIALEHISFLSHTAPTVVYVVPTFYWISRTKGKELIDTWPDRRTGGDDNRLHTIVKLDSETFRENFKKL